MRCEEPRNLGLALQVLLQRLDDEASVVVGHLDIFSDDREAETERHLELGATIVGRYERWTVLRDPSGRVYCIIARPATAR